MKQNLLRKFIPHVIAFVVFLLIAIIYCQPAFDGQVVKQHDISSFKGMAQESFEYRDKNGHFPLWTNSLFSGMPTFQITAPSNNTLPGILHTIFTLGLPEPVQFFFLACICFYFLAIVLRVNPYVGIMGALAYAYATYNPVIIGAGHVTKMITMAYLPALLGSLLLIYERKYWVGAALTAIFTSIVIAMNHPQVAYYFFLAVAIMTIFFVVRWIMAKEYKHLALAFGFTGVSVLIGFLTTAVTVFSTFEYQKESIRGKSSPLTDTTQTAKVKDGLDPKYASSYSIAVPEALVMMVPRMYGGSSDPDHEVISDDKSKALEAQARLDDDIRNQVRRSYYWGGIKDLGGNVFTSGPPYVGAIICFLAILGCFAVDRKHRWWLITATVFTIFLAWGSYFKEFNDFLFNNFPLYNKFRAPSIALVIPQLLLPVMAMLAVNAYVTAPDKKALWPAFKKGLIATGAVFVLLFLLYFSFSYSLPIEKRILGNVQEGNPDWYAGLKAFYDGVAEDRKSMFMSDIWRSFGFIAAAALVLFLLIRKTLSGTAAAILLAVFAFVDLILVDVVYLNKDFYEDKTVNEAAFIENDLDKKILTDTSYYRVLTLQGGEENNTSYNYRSVTGYHAAKLRLYNDILTHRLPMEEAMIMQSLNANKGVLGPVHTPTLNMLNTKYFLYKQGDPISRQPVTAQYWINPNALGAAWFVDTLQYVKDADAEMNAIGIINPATTAVMQETYRSSIPFQPQPDSAATISLVRNNNDIINYTSSSATNQFAVFSEVYYQAGWKAFIDGKETPIVKVNYILRGLAVPAGKHAIEFRFEPSGYYKGRKITSVATILLLVLIAAAAFMVWRDSRKKPAAPQPKTSDPKANKPEKI